MQAVMSDWVLTWYREVKGLDSEIDSDWIYMTVRLGVAAFSWRQDLYPDAFNPSTGLEIEMADTVMLKCSLFNSGPCVCQRVHVFLNIPD